MASVFERFRMENEVSKVFRGSYGVTVTPFTEGGKSIDQAALKRFLDWQIEAGSPGVIILGPLANS